MKAKGKPPGKAPTAPALVVEDRVSDGEDDYARNPYQNIDTENHAIVNDSDSD